MAGSGKGRRKRSGKGKLRPPLKDHSSSSHSQEDSDAAVLAEELTALSAIFQEDFKLLSEKPFPEFTIALRPHTSDDWFNEQNISAELLVRCIHGYPHKSPKLHVVSKHGLLEDEVHMLRSMLLDQAASIAREGRVMVFNLVEVAQEFLSERRTGAAVQLEHILEDEPFDVTKDRVTRTAASSIKGINIDANAFPAIDLFHDLWSENELWDGGLEAGGSGHGGSNKTIATFLEDKHESARHHTIFVKKPAIQENHELESAVRRLPLFEVCDENLERSLHAESQDFLEDAKEGQEAEVSTKPTRSSSVTEILQKVHSSLTRINAESDAEVHSLFPTSSRPSSPSFRDTASQTIQKDLILGHLLRLVCGPRGPMPNMLPVLASELQKIAIIHSWVENLVVREPQLFDLTFQQVFMEQNLRSRADISEPHIRSAVSSFWNASFDLLGEGKNASAWNSRYLTDFEELSLLGKGGFGHVVLCMNKLDGRQYAVKKIRLKDNNPSIDKKILREVATLSRLQHQHVVRYYQAWVETSIGSSLALLNGFPDEFDSSSDWIMTKGIEEIGDDLHSGDRAAVHTEGANLKAFTVTFLYIQMEYCPRTLRDVFDSYAGPLDKEVTWKIFRQIVEGLAHIHGQGIIHRDLTPSNIFIDSWNDIKIGDFGLAKFADLEQSERDTFPSNIEKNGGSLEGTGQVGTYFYTAPEVEQGLPNINEKVDMYSLGVVLFELWHPFNTAMERIVTLSELKHKGILPSTWVTEFSQQATMVRLLMSPYPANRPSALKVLRSDLIPPRMEDEALNDILRTIQSADDNAVYDQVIAAIFAEERHTMKSRNTDRENVKLKRRDLDMLSMKYVGAQDRVLEMAKEVFIRHGARHFESARISVVDDPDRCDRNSVKIVNSSGRMLALRCETRLSFARWVAVTQTTSIKRYELSRVYRKGLGHCPPNEYFQGDFDVIGGSPILVEAEAIKVAVEIVTKFPGLETCEVRVNHRQILRAIWTWVGVKEEEILDVTQILATMALARPQSTDRKSKWVLVRRQLLQGLRLSELIVDRLQIVERRFCGNVDEVLPRLRGALPPHPSILSAMDDLCLLQNHLRVWHLERFASIDVLMAPAEQYFDGIFFQVYLPKGCFTTTTQAMLLAVGGRYDHLLQRDWPEFSVFSAPGAVGLSIALQKLILIGAADSKFEPVTDVLVCSRGGGGLLKERMEVASELWSANIKAEYVCSPMPSLTEQYEYAHEHGIKWLVIITEAGLAHTASVKVRHLELKVEEEVSRDDLVKFISDSASMPIGRKRASLLRHGSIVP
ncbi:hypothetical protein O6H91_01G110500 [Diphasiastrum complanatum]|uniref:Uncharacterized protein n=6 Tax=Diphasiastrum complanatum TaxID=34168 RepID=A0ACC2EUU1_DIPCM|nr:hypothetical protein O6H91_01G110500 [Diphasiastrum complanatum]KAJ7570218.1 hypothetical protein O6H91_01G110500 [Diphasiastrum complanatum]KAJ7570219.1 hypothetical protein O6H91_01G110500 [Diphasiastrum complanatum]KAJ7570220.1 hypothetical protein O6H91_01G110500 [Diphasiastrum complanatum]KAJ7570222.1 hypothetical protein O6H91_01G110500 [Diphasiastrum complanatum]